MDEVRKLFWLAALLAAAQDTAEWRRSYEETLRRPDGWLSLIGLHWLEEGQPHGDILEGAVFTLRGKEVFVRRNGEERAMGAARIVVGTRSYQAIARGGRFAIRARDTESAARREFHGLRWFPEDPAWRIEAQWKPYPAPQPRQVDSVGGIRQAMMASGVAIFRWNGIEYQLEPFDDGEELMFVFKDATARNTTYPGGRFLYTPKPRGNQLTIDFNRAENPPCAYTPYATCPLAPKRNQLPFPVEAGERRYRD